LGQLRLFGRNPTTETELFCAQQTVHAAHKLVQHTAAASQVVIKINMPETACMITGQPDRFEQVIVNLLRNGIDAAQDQPNAQVVLDLTEHEDAVILRVSDNGFGLGDLVIADLREPFFSTKPSGKGMGLGLAISGQIVNEMGGTLHAENNLDHGAVFSVTFPKGDAINV
jgi:two-component system C4-dicarboxylate transport sensor histidine kinase DctB